MLVFTFLFVYCLSDFVVYVCVCVACLLFMFAVRLFVGLRVRACVRESVRAWVHACMRACMRLCAFV